MIQQNSANLKVMDSQKKQQTTALLGSPVLKSGAVKKLGIVQIILGLITSGAASAVTLLLSPDWYENRSGLWIGIWLFIVGCVGVATAPHSKRDCMTVSNVVLNIITVVVAAVECYIFVVCFFKYVNSGCYYTDYKYIQAQQYQPKPFDTSTNSIYGSKNTYNPLANEEQKYIPKFVKNIFDNNRNDNDNDDNNNRNDNDNDDNNNRNDNDNDDNNNSNDNDNSNNNDDNDNNNRKNNYNKKNLFSYITVYNCFRKNVGMGLYGGLSIMMLVEVLAALISAVYMYRKGCNSKESQSFHFVRTVTGDQVLAVSTPRENYTNPNNQRCVSSYQSSDFQEKSNNDDIKSLRGNYIGDRNEAVNPAYSFTPEASDKQPLLYSAPSAPVIDPIDLRGAPPQYTPF